MSLNRRNFLTHTSLATGAAGIFTTLGLSSAAFGVENSLDTDPHHVQKATKALGNFDLSFSESHAKQINWTYMNSNGVGISFPMLEADNGITHPKNDLLSWEFQKNDDFFSTDQNSQIDGKFVIITRNDDKNIFHSLAVAKRNDSDDSLELVGVMTREEFFYEKNIPLNDLEATGDNLLFLSAIENFSQDDAFTGIFVSKHIFAVVALNHTGIPRILYALDDRDENLSVIDGNFPEVRYTPGYSLSYPKHNLTNDHKYGIFLQSPSQDLFLYHLESDGLKLVKAFQEKKDNPNLVANFKTANYDWYSKNQAKNNRPGDAFLQALYNQGKNKETLLHWRLQDGHHAFVTIHKTPVGEYEIVPRTLIKAYENIDDSQWTLRPFDQINTIISSSHADAPDHLVLWNRQLGCAFLSFENSVSQEFQPQVLHSMALDEKFHENSDVTFQAGSDFFYPNHNLTQNRRKLHAKAYQQTRTQIDSTGTTSGLFTETSLNDIRYRVHMHSRAHSQIHSLDYKRGQTTSNTALLSAQQSQRIQFTEHSSGIQLNPPKVLEATDTFSQNLPTPQDAANQFWVRFLNEKNPDEDQLESILNPVMNIWGDYPAIYTDFQNQISAAISIYRDSFGAQENWISLFQEAVTRQIKEQIRIDQDRIREEFKKDAPYVMPFIASILVVPGAYFGIYDPMTQGISNFMVNNVLKHKLESFYFATLSESNNSSLLKQFEAKVTEIQNTAGILTEKRENLENALKEMLSLAKKPEISSCLKAHSIFEEAQDILTSASKPVMSGMSEETSDILKDFMECKENAMAPVRGPTAILAGTFAISALVGLGICLQETL